MKIMEIDRLKYGDQWQAWYNKYYDLRLLDRTKTHSYNFDYDVITPIPEITKYNGDTLKEICIKEAKRIYSIAQKPLSLMYSGGIDSTMIACIFIELDIPFTLLYTPESIIENPKFFTEITSGYLSNDKIKFVNIKDMDNIRLFLNQYHTVTGSLGDQLLNHKYIFTDDTYSTLKDCLLDSWQEVDADLVQLLENQIPSYIENYCDFIWWMNFSCRFQFLQVFHYGIHGFNHFRRENDFTHFFESDEMQLWGMNNRKLINEFAYDNEPLQQKKPFKEIIFDTFYDLDYFENKIKKISLTDLIQDHERKYLISNTCLDEKGFIIY